MNRINNCIRFPCKSTAGKFSIEVKVHVNDHTQSFVGVAVGKYKGVSLYAALLHAPRFFLEDAPSCVWFFMGPINDAGLGWRYLHTPRFFMGYLEQ